MDHVLLSYQDIKILASADCNMEAITRNLPRIVELHSRVVAYYKALMNTPKDAIQAMSDERDSLRIEIGGTLVGVPFSNQDAEMYALSNRIDFVQIELTDHE
jgi:hypothetical protein